MLGFVQNFLFRPPAYPIGIDWDGTNLRLAQVERVGEGFRLRAAAHKRWPGEQLQAGKVREALSESEFAGRDAIFTPPATLVRLFTADADAPVAIEAEDRLIRGWTTPGGVQLVSEANKPAIAALLHTLAEAGLCVRAVGLLPRIIHDLSRRVFRRSHERNCTTLHLHLGDLATTWFVAQAGALRLVGQSEFGRPTMVRAIAEALDLSESLADHLRQRLLHAAAPIDWGFDRTLIHRPAFGQHGHPIHDQTDTESARLCGDSQRLHAAVSHAVGPLIEELKQLRAESNATIDRIVFSGSEALDRPLCETIARRLKIPAHVLDPILRLQNSGSRMLAGGMDRRLPQPAWAAAIGASMGTLTSAEVAA